MNEASVIMPKPDGLCIDATRNYYDRLPMLARILALKLLADLGLQREGEASPTGKWFIPASEFPFSQQSITRKREGGTAESRNTRKARDLGIDRGLLPSERLLIPKVLFFRDFPDLPEAVGDHTGHFPPGCQAAAAEALFLCSASVTEAVGRASPRAASARIRPAPTLQVPSGSRGRSPHP